MGDGVKCTSAERSWTNVRTHPAPGNLFYIGKPGTTSCSGPTASASLALGGRTPTRNARLSVTAGKLLADAESLNDSLVAFGIRLSEVIEQTTTPAHHHEKTAP